MGQIANTYTGRKRTRRGLKAEYQGAPHHDPIRWNRLLRGRTLFVSLTRVFASLSARQLF